VWRQPSPRGTPMTHQAPETPESDVDVPETPMEVLELVRSILLRLTWAITEDVDDETRETLHRQGNEAFAALGRLDATGGYVMGPNLRIYRERGGVSATLAPEPEGFGDDRPAVLLTMREEPEAESTPHPPREERRG